MNVDKDKVVSAGESAPTTVESVDSVSDSSTPLKKTESESKEESKDHMGAKELNDLLEKKLTTVSTETDAKIETCSKKSSKERTSRDRHSGSSSGSRSRRDARRTSHSRSRSRRRRSRHRDRGRYRGRRSRSRSVSRSPHSSSRSRHSRHRRSHRRDHADRHRRRDDRRRHRHRRGSHSRSRSRSGHRSHSGDKESKDAVSRRRQTSALLQAAITGGNPLVPGMGTALPGASNPLTAAVAGVSGIGGAINPGVAGGNPNLNVAVQSLIGALSTGNLAQLLQGNVMVDSTQATRPSRRLYVGNLPIDLQFNEQVLLEFFAQCCASFGVRTPRPVQSVWIHTERTFGFIEFRSVRDTTLCMKLFESLPLGGRQLRFGRPMDYKAPPSHLEYYFVEGVDANAVDSDKSPALRFLEPGSAAELIARQLFLKEDISALVAAKMGSAALGATETAAVAPSTMSGGTTVAVTSTATVQSAGSGVTTGDETVVKNRKIVVICNMFDGDIDLGDDDTFNEVIEDVMQTCLNFGAVVSVVIPKPADLGHGRCFVEFDDERGARACFAGMSGRTFDASTVECHWFEKALFDSHKFSADFCD